MRSNHIRNTILVVTGIRLGYDFVAGKRDAMHALSAKLSKSRHLLARLKPSLSALATRMYLGLSATCAAAPSGAPTPPRQERLQERLQGFETCCFGADWRGSIVPVLVGSCRVS